MWQSARRTEPQYFIVDYNYNRSEGDLMYFNGKEVRTLDQDVSGFCIRDGSTGV